MEFDHLRFEEEMMASCSSSPSSSSSSPSLTVLLLLDGAFSMGIPFIKSSTFGVGSPVAWQGSSTLDPSDSIRFENRLNVSPENVGLDWTCDGNKPHDGG